MSSPDVNYGESRAWIAYLICALGIETGLAMIALGVAPNLVSAGIMFLGENLLAGGVWLGGAALNRHRRRARIQN